MSTLNRHRRRKAVHRRGATLIEFAVSASVFFAMVLGIFEFGRAMMVQSLITCAAQKGARTGALNGATTTDVTNSVTNFLTASKVNGVTTTVSPSPPSSALPGQDVTVTVSVPYGSVSWLGAPKYLKNKTLVAKAIVQRESGS